MVNLQRVRQTALVLDILHLFLPFHYNIIHLNAEILSIHYPVHTAAWMENDFSWWFRFLRIIIGYQTPWSCTIDLPDTSYPACSTGCSHSLLLESRHTLTGTDLKPAAFKVGVEQRWLSDPDVICWWGVQLCDVCMCVWMCPWVSRTKRDKQHHTPCWVLSGGIKCGCHFNITTHTRLALFKCPGVNTMSSDGNGPDTSGKAKVAHQKSSPQCLLHWSTGCRSENYSQLVCNQQLVYGQYEAWCSTDGN